MAEKSDKSVVDRVSPTDSVELNVKITEGSDGGLHVGYSANIAGTDKRFHPRATHVVGQLVCAAMFVLLENFDTIQAELSGKLSRTSTETPTSS